MQSYEPNPDLLSLQTGLEMLGMAPKNTSLHQQDHPNRDQTHYYQQSTDQFNNLMVVDDSSLRCLFPSQGLSLSLCNSTPPSLALQQQMDQIRAAQSQGQSEDILMQDGRLLMSQGFYQQQVPQQLRNCKYLLPTQELLKEFCNILPNGVDQKKKTTKRSNQWGGGGQSSSFSSAAAAAATWNQSLQSLDILELQRRKARLYAMLEEVDRRYRKYCEQMWSVVASFEAVAGEGAAAVYTTLASKAMSRHFRCLRDGIVGQVKATKKAMGEKDQVTSGSTRGETPRLKLLDQCIRQQKAFQQGGIMENHPWRPQRGLPERSVSLLRAWLFEHFLNPYPSDVDKHILARQTGLSRSQVSNWFINARVRLWKPMVEEMYLEETMERENPSSQAAATTSTGLQDTTNQDQLSSSPNPNPNPNPNHTHSSHLDEDQKPDYDSLSSIINSSAYASDRNNHNQYPFPRPADNFGVVDIDFSSYSNGGDGSGSSRSVAHQRFGSGAVSLTLGLKQHNGGGGAMGMPFSSGTPQQSMFFSRSEQQIENCQPVQFSVNMDGDAQNLIPYRNLMGAQLLHDLAG